MKKLNSDAVKIIPLGGLEQIGMNITAIEYEDSIIVIDCGLAFPEDDMLGIDLVIPDVTYLKENADKVKGLVVTHGHEDHIGAIPYIEKELNMPIYATKLTMGLIENKLKEHNLMNNTRRKVVKYGQNIILGKFRIEFIKTNHSIADSAALAIYTPAGLLVHTGDFKIDYTPVFGDMIDLLDDGGRIAVITFHSLEDRIVKNAMASAAKGCICPPEFPVCVCGRKPQVDIITRKPIVSTPEELERNPRARSAKLRVCQKR